MNCWRRCVRTSCRISPSVTDDASLLELGVVDSTGLLDVFEWLRDEFGIEVLDAEMVPDNFDGVARIAAYIGRKLAPA